MRMNQLVAPFALLMAAALTACGGGGDSGGAFQGGSGSGSNTTPANTVAAVTVTASTPSLASANNTPVEIRAYVRNANNQYITNVPVTISPSSGGITVSQGTTDAAGVAVASLDTAGDPTNRTITVTATAQGVSGTVKVDVVGSAVGIQGPDALVINSAGSYTVTMLDSNGSPIANKAVTISTSPSTTLSATSLTTDSTGRATFNMTPTSGGTVTVTATGVGGTAKKSVAVSADSFAFTAPAVGAQAALATPVTLSVRWLTNGVAVPNGQTVTFAATRGTLSSSTAVTSSGVASVTLQSATAGDSIITASNPNGGSTQIQVTFVAGTATAISVQASPFTISINRSSTITAVVRDANNNLVAGKVVNFSNAGDTTGGSLSASTSTTDSQGRATVVYTASSTTSANNGVIVTARVADAPSVTGQVALTVAGAPLFIKFGTGNSIQQINNDTQYQLPYAVQVTDANGVGVANVVVSISVLPWNYFKGYRTWNGTNWTTTVTASCVNEDRRTGNALYDFNGILDPGEDENGSNPFANSQLTLEPGNVASVSPGSGTTDANGFLFVNVTYPQDQAYYVSAVMRATTQVQGTAFVSTSSPFSLPGAADDFNQQSVAPPGPFSPYGVNTTCSDHF